MRLRHHHIIGGAGGEAAHFLGDLDIQITFLFLDRLHPGMQRAIFAGEVTFLGEEGRLLAAQLHDQWRGNDLGDIGWISRRHQLAYAIGDRLLFRQFGARRHDLGVDPDHLLVDDGIAGCGIVQIVFGLVALHRFLLD